MEVAISVQFNQLAKFQPVHFGLLWERLRAEYPKTEHHPPLASTVELFGTQLPARTALRIESSASFPTGRCWFLNADNQRLVQVQSDRFILNWRQVSAGSQYPSYKTLREDFRRELDRLLAFVAAEDLGSFEPVQCEVIYVNHLLATQGWSRINELPSVIALSSSNATDPSLPDLEDAQLAWQYRFDEGEKPLGRLHVHVQSGVRTQDGLPLIVLQMTGRGAPIGPGVDGVLALTDRAHEWIVNGFTAVTTERMHTIWERQR